MSFRLRYVTELRRGDEVLAMTSWPRPPGGRSGREHSWLLARWLRDLTDCKPILRDDALVTYVRKV